MPEDTPSRLERPNKRLTNEQIESNSTADLRAIAFQRGYDLPDVGGLSLRRAFLKAQNADETAEAVEDGADLEGADESDEDNEV